MSYGKLGERRTLRGEERETGFQIQHVYTQTRTNESTHNGSAQSTQQASASTIVSMIGKGEKTGGMQEIMVNDSKGGRRGRGVLIGGWRETES